MKVNVTINVKCVNCKHFIFEDENGNYNDDNCYCKLDGSIKDYKDECEKLEIHDKDFRLAFDTIGFKRIKYDFTN